MWRVRPPRRGRHPDPRRRSWLSAANPGASSWRSPGTSRSSWSSGWRSRASPSALDATPDRRGILRRGCPCRPAEPDLIRSIAHRLAGEQLALPVEGRLASFSGATGWLHSEPLTPEGLRGRVVLVDFWTYTCVNWLRTLPYVRAWAAKYARRRPHHRRRAHARVRVRAGPRQRRRGRGLLRRHVPGRARPRLRGLERLREPLLAGRVPRGRRRADPVTTTSARVSTRRPRWRSSSCCMDAGVEGVDQDLVDVEPVGLEVAADWRTSSRPRRTRDTGRAPASRRPRSLASTGPVPTPLPRGYPSITGGSRGRGRWPDTLPC